MKFSIRDAFISSLILSLTQAQLGQASPVTTQPELTAESASCIDRLSQLKQQTLQRKLNRYNGVAYQSADFGITGLALITTLMYGMTSGATEIELAKLTILQSRVNTLEALFSDTLKTAQKDIELYSRLVEQSPNMGTYAERLREARKTAQQSKKIIDYIRSNQQLLIDFIKDISSFAPKTQLTQAEIALIRRASTQNLQQVVTQAELDAIASRISLASLRAGEVKTFGQELMKLLKDFGGRSGGAVPVVALIMASHFFTGATHQKNEEIVYPEHFEFLLFFQPEKLCEIESRQPSLYQSAYNNFLSHQTRIDGLFHGLKSIEIQNTVLPDATYVSPRH